MLLHAGLRRVRAALPHSREARENGLGLESCRKRGALPPAPYELADGSAEMMAPLWGKNFRIEPFFACVFANEFCSLLPGEELMAAREKDLAHSSSVRSSFPRGWFSSVFTPGPPIKSISITSGSRASAKFWDRHPSPAPFRSNRARMRASSSAFSTKFLPAKKSRCHRRYTFAARNERVAQKIVARLNRVHGENLIGPLRSTVRFTEKGGLPMAKLGKLSTRSPDSFGVVGLLGDDCKIYYDSIFSARHIGRVSDLLTAH